MKKKQLPTATRPCIYCGEPIRKLKRGEHVIPEAIGGTRCLKTVCTTCNNEVLSETASAKEERGRRMAGRYHASAARTERYTQVR
jgi:hypothetical protein